MSISRLGKTFVKTDHETPKAVELESLGLRWLSEAMNSGGAHVVPVEDVQPGQLTTRRVQSTPCTAESAYQFGRALALTHAAGADFYGQAPKGWEGDGWMGRAPLPLQTKTTAHDTWGGFYAKERILPHLPAAVDNGAIARFDIYVVEQLCERLRDGDFDASQPALVTKKAARIHGDLWSGNVLWSRANTLDWAPDGAGLGTSDSLPDVVGVLIDPAAHGGHAETDLAYLGVFGQPYWDKVYAGYNAESPLEPSWPKRISLHQLHIVMVHAHLFGGSYGDQAITLAKQYVH